MSRPRILVCLDFDDHHGFFLKENYWKALKAAGAEVIPLLYDHDYLEKAIESASGVFLPGGLADVDPKYYQEERCHERTKVNMRRCEFEFDLIRASVDRKLPLLAVCFGFQIVNVFFGGSLHQHLPEDLPSDLEHEQKLPSHHPTHWVHLEPNSQARQLFCCEKLHVNSTHHQGVKTLAPGLICEGKAEDGLIEIFRHPEFRFFWGVQWHPERLEGDPIIPSFVEACRLPNR